MPILKWILENARKKRLKDKKSVTLPPPCSFGLYVWNIQLINIYIIIFHYYFKNMFAFNLFTSNVRFANP